MSERVQKRVVLATSNTGKVRELQALLAPLDLEVVPKSQFTREDVAETGDSFVANALIKARHAAAVSGLPAIADDSGIEVDALQGAPGIYSARFAGPGATDAQNLHKLLTELEGVAAAQRTARYRCALVYVRTADDPAPLVCEAAWDGRLLRESRGSGGFGYDPVFALLDRDVTAAELDPVEKNQLSHRGQALQQLLAALRHKGEL